MYVLVANATQITLAKFAKNIMKAYAVALVPDSASTIWITYRGATKTISFSVI
jgi:hypothetical protein